MPSRRTAVPVPTAARPIATALACALLAAAPIAAQDAPAGREPITTKDRHVQLRLHPGALPAPLARQLADEAWQAVQASKALLEDHRTLPSKPVQIEVYADASAFRTQLNRCGPPIVVEEFAVSLADTAHVQLSPRLSADALAFVGLPPETRDGIVRQLGWLCASQTEVGKSDPWLCEVYAAGLLDALDNPGLASGVDPRFEGRRRIYRWVAGQGRAFTLGEWVDHPSPPYERQDLDASREMAGWCAQLLAAASKSWPRKLLKRSRAARRLIKTTDVRRAQLEQLLDDDWSETEIRLSRLVKADTSGWMAERPAVARCDGRLLLASDNEDHGNALAVWLGEVPKGAFAIRGEYELAPVGVEQWRLEFVDGERVLAVALGADRCLISRWQGGDEWHNLAESELRDERRPRGTFAIEVADRLRVRVDDAEVIEAPYGNHAMRKTLALVASHCVVWLRDLRIEPLAAQDR